MVYTDRTEPGADFNRVLGADARLILGGRYTLDVMAAGSADGDAGEATRWGSLFSASLDRSGRQFSAEASFQDIDDDFVAGSGFIRRTGITRFETEARYSFLGERGDLLESVTPTVEAEGIWAEMISGRGRGPQESSLGLGLRASFRGNIGTFLDVRRNSFSFDPGFYAPFVRGSSEMSLAPVFELRRALLGSLLREPALLGQPVGAGPVLRRRRMAGDPALRLRVPMDLGESWNGDVGVTVYPTGSMQAELGARHVSIFRKRDGSRYSSATIPRLQARYQISRTLFVRGIGEYSSQERGDILDPLTGEPIFECEDGSCGVLSGSDSHDFRFEALLAYERSPGSVFFLGYTRQFEDTSAFDFRRVQPVADGFFVKLSYRFRM